MAFLATKYLELFINDFRKKQLDVSLVKGRIQLDHAQLNVDVLQTLLGFSPAIRLSSATCGSLSLNVPWSKLRTEAVKISLGSLTLQFEEVSDEKMVPNQPLPPLLSKSKAEMKQAKKKKRKSSNASPSKPNNSSNTSSSKLKRHWYDAIIENVQIDIGVVNMVLRTLPISGEDGEKTSLSITMESLRLHSCNGRWEPWDVSQLVQANKRQPLVNIFKHISVGKLSFAVVVDGERERTKGAKKKTTGLSNVASLPLDCKIHAARCHRAGHLTSMTVKLMIEDVTLDWTPVCVRRLVHAVDGLRACLARNAIAAAKSSDASSPSSVEPSEDIDLRENIRQLKELNLDEETESRTTAFFKPWADVRFVLSVGAFGAQLSSNPPLNAAANQIVLKLRSFVGERVRYNAKLLDERVGGGVEEDPLLFCPDDDQFSDGNEWFPEPNDEDDSINAFGSSADERNHQVAFTFNFLTAKHGSAQMFKARTARDLFVVAMKGSSATSSWRRITSLRVRSRMAGFSVMMPDQLGETFSSLFPQSDQRRILERSPTPPQAPSSSPSARNSQFSLIPSNHEHLFVDLAVGQILINAPVTGAGLTLSLELERLQCAIDRQQPSLRLRLLGLNCRFMSDTVDSDGLDHPVEIDLRMYLWSSPTDTPIDMEISPIAVSLSTSILAQLTNKNHQQTLSSSSSSSITTATTSTPNEKNLIPNLLGRPLLSNKVPLFVGRVRFRLSQLTFALNGHMNDILDGSHDHDHETHSTPSLVGTVGFTGGVEFLLDRPGAGWSFRCFGLQGRLTEDMVAGLLREPTGVVSVQLQCAMPTLANLEFVEGPDGDDSFSRTLTAGNFDLILIPCDGCCSTDILVGPLIIDIDDDDASKPTKANSYAALVSLLAQLAEHHGMRLSGVAVFVGNSSGKPFFVIGDGSADHQASLDASAKALVNERRAQEALVEMRDEERHTSALLIATKVELAETKAQLLLTKHHARVAERRADALAQAMRESAHAPVASTRSGSRAAATTSAVSAVVSRLTSENVELKDKLGSAQREHDALRAQLAHNRVIMDQLEERVAEGQRRLAEKQKEAESIARSNQELEDELAKLNHLVSERETQLLNIQQQRMAQMEQEFL